MSIILFNISCTSGISPSSSVSSFISIHYTRGYMGDYSEARQGQILSKKVLIFVDKLNENYQIDSNFSSLVYNGTNSANPQDCIFPNVKVPKTGSYSITVETQGEECYTNCTQNSSCENLGEGKPYFRKVIIVTNTIESPDSFYIDPPGFVDCF